MPRRIQNTTIAITAPTTNGMRQPQAYSSASVKQVLQQHLQQHGGQLAADQRHVQEAGPEAAATFAAISLT